jgi:hypothetical protein
MKVTSFSAVLVVFSMVAIQFGSVAEAGRSDRKKSRNPVTGFQTPGQFIQEFNYSSNDPVEVKDDSDLVRAVNDRKNVFFVQAGQVQVIQILPDDNKGLKHQRWYVQLSNGSKVFAVYNTDVTARVPLQVGQVMSLGGEFKWTQDGALIHWLHEDPKNRRPDGYVEINGKKFGEMH